MAAKVANKQFSGLAKHRVSSAEVILFTRKVVKYKLISSKHKVVYQSEKCTPLGINAFTPQ